MPGSAIQIALDCRDPDAMADFWAVALGYVVQPPPAGFDTWEAALAAWQVPRERWGSASAVIDPDGNGPRLFLQRVPEPKEVKNRMHLDVVVPVAAGEDGWAAVLAHVERLEALGAKRVQEFDEMGAHWMTCLDPEGNEFDVCAPESS